MVKNIIVNNESLEAALNAVASDGDLDALKQATENLVVYNAQNSTQENKSADSDNRALPSQEPKETSNG